MTLSLHSSPLADAFFKPLVELSVPGHLTRDCPGLSDQDFLRLGLLRTLGAETTGRPFPLGVLRKNPAARIYPDGGAIHYYSFPPRTPVRGGGTGRPRRTGNRKSGWRIPPSSPELP